MNTLKTLSGQVLALVLLLQAVAYYAVASREDIIPAVSPLRAFPQSVGGWTMVREYEIEKEVQEVLRADDTLNRVYASPQRTDSASLFMAFFKTQRYGQAPHSPKNCLPGAGWQATEDSKLSIDVPGAAPIVVNKYVIERGEHKSVVLYWYQSHNRVIAGELAAKFWLVADAIRYSRSDTALVRVIVPTEGGGTAEKTAVEFVRAVYPDIARQLPK
jgi:EpsI family protein